MEYNFTPVPNWFFKVAPDLNNTELRIMLLVYSQTVAWPAGQDQRQTSNTLSYTFIQNEAGIKSRTAINLALTGLVDRGLITRSTRRQTGQFITVYPLSPILPVEVVMKSDSIVHESDSMSHEIRPLESVNQTHIKKTPKEPISETTTGQELTESQQFCVNLLVVAGIHQDISRQLIVTAWENGHDSEYIQDITGYVAQQVTRNPAGYIRDLIEKNRTVKPASSGAQAANKLTPGIDLAKYAHGGKSHKFANDTCVICHPELEREEA